MKNDLATRKQDKFIDKVKSDIEANQMIDLDEKLN